MQLVFKPRDRGDDSVESEQLALASKQCQQASSAEVRRYEILEDGQRVYDAWIFANNDGAFFVAGSKDRAPFELANGVVKAREELTEVERCDALQQAYDGILSER
jgi:hypothetical protein